MATREGSDLKKPYAIIGDVITLDNLRRFSVARNFFKPTTLKSALERMSFVQADPIRAPARAQDLILRQRVKNYHAGELERRYASLNIEEDVFVNYGYVTKALHALMHPRSGINGEEGKRRTGREELLLNYVRKRGEVHPREVDEQFAHGKVTNYWGGSSNATTRLLESMHYQGRLRVVRREKGIRIYATRQQEGASIDAAERRARVDELVNVVVRIYAPLSGTSLSTYVRRLRYAVPQWQDELANALQRAKERLGHAHCQGVEWYWPADENVLVAAPDDAVRLLAPFDPVVHDRARFELFWGWAYRFEAYTPVAKRKLGYYALPLLWRDRVIGWGNVSVNNGELNSQFGYLPSQPRDRAFKQALAEEIEGLQRFLGLEP
ncbi:MAG TPA: crosslink repair DNA glycosylase YcaQ family protein [Pyrinomonadaceae bacterium]|nr:crosslink repair DNA glycosylase YcaQ family protein [Pyrinomonadaceae bacterium]